MSVELNAIATNKLTISCDNFDQNLDVFMKLNYFDSLSTTIVQY